MYACLVLVPATVNCFHSLLSFPKLFHICYYYPIKFQPYLLVSLMKINPKLLLVYSNVISLHPLLKIFYKIISAASNLKCQYWLSFKKLSSNYQSSLIKNVTTKSPLIFSSELIIVISLARVFLISIVFSKNGRFFGRFPSVFTEVFIIFKRNLIQPQYIFIAVAVFAFCFSMKTSTCVPN